VKKLGIEEEALSRTLWRTRFGKGYGPVVRQTTWWWEGTFRKLGSYRRI